METIVCSCIQQCIQPLMSCIGTPVIRQFGYLKAKENVEKLMRHAGDLKAMKKDIQDQIDAASREGKHCTNVVRRWIQKVEGLGDEVTIVQSDYDQRGRSCWPNCWSSYKIGRRASKLLIKLTDLEIERAGFNDVLTIDAPPASVVQQMSTTSNVVGSMITFNKKKICGYLEEEETDGVIGIQGMGGVGKTTLLEAFNHNNFLNNNGDSGINELFDYVIFITVSKDHQLENLQKKIVKRLGLRSSEDLVSQAQIISEYLKEKNFLLLLDDIWEVVQLKDLGIPYPRSSSERRFRRKVVFTTRSSQVCAGMKCHKKIEVKCLKEDEAWDLFKESVGEDIINLPGIRSRAKEMIKECGGLPLALVVIGRVMATKERPGEWDHALTQLKKSQPSKIHGMEKEENYFLRLKFSYDSLGDDKMRKCFLCCSLWPEDFRIKKEELIMCWMGLGLIDGFENIKEAYDEGDSLIGSLIVASLLQHVEDKDDVIKVHDVIRDLALWIACDSGTNRNRWLVKAGAGLEEVPSEVVANWGVAERVSLMRSGIKDLPHHLLTCPNLSTLLLQVNNFTFISESFFTCMPNLTYLDLSDTNLREIPKEICCSVQLRYLNLSNTYISSLPEELGQLINLKYLLLRNIDIKEVNRGIIGRLLKLEYLDLFPFGSVETDELLRLPLLKGVGMKITSEHALQQLSRVPVPILDLNIELDMGGDSSSIHLHHLLSSFKRLRRLDIWGCHGLKDITWVLHLPCLEELSLYDCKEMEQLVVIGGGEGRELEVTKPTFPRLRILELVDLPKLAMICDNHAVAAAAAAVNFPFLEVLHVRNCNGLKKLPFHLPRLESLELIGLENLTEIVWRSVVPPSECFQRLRRLNIGGCNGLKDITWVLHLPCLENLVVQRCNEMEQLVVIGGGEGRELEVTEPTFPRLRHLHLWDLPKLTMICDNHAAAAVNFPSLEQLIVYGCKELKRLPFHPQLLNNNNNCSRLKEIRGESEWWEGIEWEDQSAQSSLLQPYFQTR